jgi:subtilase family serine protease
MMIKRAIYLILICALTNFCCVKLKLLSKDGVKITGIILDGESKEVMIGQGVSEIDNQMNNTMTNMNGEFEIILENNIPVIVLDGHYEPIYVEIKKGQKNIIHIDKKLINRSRKTYQNGINLVKFEN